jgi:hypothetical protein
MRPSQILAATAQKTKTTKPIGISKVKKDKVSPFRELVIDRWRQLGESRNRRITNVLAGDFYKATWTALTDQLVKNGRVLIPNIGTFLIR